MRERSCTAASRPRTGARRTSRACSEPTRCPSATCASAWRTASGARCSRTASTRASSRTRTGSSGCRTGRGRAASSCSLDPRTGLRDAKTTYPTNLHSDAYFGRKIAGGAYVSGEGSYILRFGGYYWLFISYGGLTARGGYNIRVFRSTRPEGPYEDRLGHTPFYDTYRLNFNDGVGVRLFGAYRWRPEGEGMVAQGHNSALVDDDGRAYIVYHTRTTAGHEGHYLRVHQLFLNRDGWLVAAPYRMRGERLARRGLPKKEIVGDYDVILHRLDVDYAHLGTAEPARLTLHADRTVTGARRGRWEAESGTPYITLTLDGPDADVYRGVALTMAIDGTNDKTTVFTALGDRTQLTLWGSRR